MGRPQTAHKLSQAHSFPDIQHGTTEHQEQNNMMIVRTEKSKSCTSCVIAKWRQKSELLMTDKPLASRSL